MRKSIIFAASIALLATSVGFIAMTKSKTNEHSAHNMAADLGQMPTQTGQSAFAAIAEIVAMLDAEDNTDWELVNIQALRDHLVDMDDVTMRSDVTSIKQNGTFVFTITGDDNVAQAIKRMVPAHAKELDKMADWSASTSLLNNGVELTITPLNEDGASKIAGLGFFGLLATGAHHQPHHLGMATGTMVH